MTSIRSATSATRANIKKVVLIVVLLGSIGLVEFYFAWTSHVITVIQTGKNELYNPTVVHFLDQQLSYLGLHQFFYSYGQSYCQARPLLTACTARDIATRSFADAETATFLVLTLITAFLTYWNRGPLKALLSSLRLVSLVIIPLGIEIYILTSPEFSDTAGVVVQSFPWLTNENILFACIAIFIVTSALLTRQPLQKYLYRLANRTDH